MKAYDLDTDDTPLYVAELQDLSEGDWVEYDDGQYGAIVGKVDGPLEWPTGDGEDDVEKIEDQGDGKQIYIVARASGGSKPYTADEISTVDREDVIDPEAVPDDPASEIDEAEMSEVYDRMDDPSSMDELLSVPGVDDPGVGFDSWPDSWREADEPARLIALDAWTSMGGTFTGCVAEIGSRRICAAFKDEMLGTERWRNRF